VRRVLPSLLLRTTAVSRHDLAAAVAGQFAERVHTLLQALGRPGLVPAAVRAARGWGATSGIDLGHGIAATAAAVGGGGGGTRVDPMSTLTSAMS
jgi:stage V sporulation protein SpoVS